MLTTFFFFWGNFSLVLLLFLKSVQANMFRNPAYHIWIISPAEAFIVICQVSPIVKYWFIPELFIIVVISAFKTKISSLHVFQFFTSELIPQLHIPVKTASVKIYSHSRQTYVQFSSSNSGTYEIKIISSEESICLTLSMHLKPDLKMYFLKREAFFSWGPREG